MIIGIAIPSLIVLIGSIFTYEYLNNVKDRQEFVEIADDIKEDVLEIRRNEKNFFLYRNAEHRDNVYNAIFLLKNTISSISREIIEDIGQEDFSVLNESVQTYTDYIDELYKSYQEETEVTEKVREEGRKLEDSVPWQRERTRRGLRQALF